MGINIVIIWQATEHGIPIRMKEKKSNYERRVNGGPKQYSITGFEILIGKSQKKILKTRNNVNKSLLLVKTLPPSIKHVQR